MKLCHITGEIEMLAVKNSFSIRGSALRAGVLQLVGRRSENGPQFSEKNEIVSVKMAVMSLT